MIHIHTAGERELVTRQSFDSFITSLKMDSRFYRCNRGVVINLEHAVDFDGTGFRLDNGSNVPVSRKLLKNARQTFMVISVTRGGPEMTDILRLYLNFRNHSRHTAGISACKKLSETDTA